MILTTFDWVPEFPRGYVSDLKVRWALEEAGLAYQVQTTPLRGKTPVHFAHQPFGQVPWLVDDGLSVFESGAILLHLAGKSPLLMPSDPVARSEVTQWLFAAASSMEPAILPYTIFKGVGDAEETPGRVRLDALFETRLKHLETVLAGRLWLVGQFSVADIAMVEILRLADRFGGLAICPACRDYVERGKARPAFARAMADQLAHFAAADAIRPAS